MKNEKKIFNSVKEQAEQQDNSTKTEYRDDYIDEHMASLFKDVAEFCRTKPSRQIGMLLEVINPLYKKQDKTILGSPNRYKVIEQSVNNMKIQEETKSYVIKKLLSNCKTMSEFKNYYDYILNLLEEEKIYSLSTFIK